MTIRNATSGEKTISAPEKTGSGLKGFVNGISLETMKEIGKHVPGGFFIYKAEGAEELLYANQVVFDIFGCSNLEQFRELTGFTFKGMLHPEDYEKNSVAIENQIAGSDDNMDHVIYRIIRRDGEVRWIDDYGHYVETADCGGVYYVFISDITESRLAMESDKAVRTAVIEALCKAYEAVMLITDVETESIVLFSHASGGGKAHVQRALDKIRYTEATNQYIDTMVDEQDREWLRKEVSLANVLANTASKKQFAVTYRRLTEKADRYYRVEFIRLNMPDGKTGIIYGFKDVDYDVRNEQLLREQLQAALDEKHEREKAFSKAQEAALKDALTGVKNKRCFARQQEQIEAKIGRDKGLRFAVVVCDINELKKVNDTRGHLAGDQYICDACQVICRIFEHSPVYRIGGDEFAVILTGPDFEKRHALMQRLFEQVHDNSKSGGVIIASGLADFFNGHDHDFKTVFDRADQAMYDNKLRLKGLR
jgi:diguanylate cyclase (GGDEF)-like protein/PAS domain S-box-containing protein